MLVYLFLYMLFIFNESVNHNFVAHNQQKYPKQFQTFQWQIFEVIVTTCWEPLLMFLCGQSYYKWLLLIYTSAQIVYMYTNWNSIGNCYFVLFK